MLNRLTVKNVALIDYTEMDFQKGLNVLSGETGAGKSVIIESLNFVLGAKAEKSLIRSGENECFVTAEFDVSGNFGVQKVFEELEFDVEDTLIITRKFSLDGKSSVKINGNSATLSMLKKFTSLLVDVHGQSEHFYLLSEVNQLKLIDKFGGDDILLLKKDIAEKYRKYKDIIENINKLGGDAKSREIRLDLLNFQIKEIETAAIKEGEEEELVSIKQKLLSEEKIMTALSFVKDALGEEGAVCDILSSAIKTASSISEISEEYNELSERLSSSYAEIDDILSTTSSLLENMDLSEYNPDTIEERLDVIKKIKRKYGDSVEDINKFLADAEKERDSLFNFDEIAKNLLEDKIKSENELYSLYLKLHKLRVESAQKFVNNVRNELKTLKIGNGDFKIEFNIVPEKNDCVFNSVGFDAPVFMFSANSGQPLKPLSEVISGGEMSRFMLAIKAETAKYEEIPTFIFDEIDAGISGETAFTVAEKFAQIAHSSQIIAISHLAQISAMADNNMLIVKTDDGKQTKTSVKQLSGKEKTEEIIRLIGGTKESAVSKQHAEEILKRANEYKQSIL